MIEKVNPKHPDKVADRIAGAIVDLAYAKDENPKIAAEVLIGHNECNIIIETSVDITNEEIHKIVTRISENETIKGNYKIVPQDKHLNKNQDKVIKCGDNGIFRGLPLTKKEKDMSLIARDIYNKYAFDGKYILDDNKCVVCQSNADSEELKNYLINTFEFQEIELIINPLGKWTGGLDVDTGAVNRKLGSDMAHAVTGGGLHGKDLSKADVSINIYAHLKAQLLNERVDISCSIGDVEVDGIPYIKIVEIARNFINALGGFEKFAEWGLF